MRIVGLPLPALALAWLLAACATRDELGGQEGEDLEDTDTTGDTGAADTGDSDDTDQDDDTADTAGGRDYVGPFVVDAVDAAGVSDRCAGTVTLPVAAGTITGVGACTFTGPLGTSFPDGLGASVSGAIGDDDAASGTVTFTVGASGALPWDGALATDLTGTFAGTLVAPSTTLTVTGTFDGAPE